MRVKVVSVTYVEKTSELLGCAPAKYDMETETVG